MKRVEIKHRWNGNVLYSTEVADDCENPLREAVLRAIAAIGDQVSAACWAGYHAAPHAVLSESLRCTGVGTFEGVVERCRCDCHGYRHLQVVTANGWRAHRKAEERRDRLSRFVGLLLVAVLAALALAAAAWGRR